ncbi:Iron-regulated protein A precursor [Enhygromyxa salina]|uniref:Iron-regulated protein A n=1 Tax=Enhygromyxa salina TaxID=215803 RepID=A0A0C1ZTI3_9BACT|nr:imelysin family protein [Enhygromyxa salina]KIG14368.1 Iron-regulated protein A precursor [Enhygromyxa salina]
MIRFGPLAALFALALGACTTDSDGSAPLDAAEVAPIAEQYALVVAANYADVQTSAATLQTSIVELVADPSEANLEAAREAWLASREFYGQTEAFRFYDGPIDEPHAGPEGQLNAWPMDEAYVDYVEGMPDAGIINDPASYPVIDAALLIELNEQGGETNIAAGYHAIEFLLWGQDLSASGPGARPWTDFDTSGAGTANNQDRRGAYLLAAAELLVADIDGLVAAWDPDQADNYRAQFVAEAPNEIVRKMLLGIGSLSGAELAGERIEVALATQDQEDEHSCFSDNTHRDIIVDIVGIQNVYLGDYASTHVGPGLYDLVAARDQALADRLTDDIQASLDAAMAIPAPFDQAIINDRDAVQATVDALRRQTDTIVEVAALFEINLALD